VVQTDNSKGYEAINSFLVSLPMADESGWLYTVDATPKVGAPTQEVTPPEPETPSKPSEPDKPSEPEKPSEPDKPTQPSTPDEPDMPVNPNDPNRPVSPGNPDNPVAPGNPDNPVAPGRPDGNALPQSGQLNWPIPFMACATCCCLPSAGCWTGRRCWHEHKAEDRPRLHDRGHPAHSGRTGPAGL